MNEEDQNPLHPLPDPFIDLLHDTYHHSKPEEPSRRPLQEIPNRFSSSNYEPQKNLHSLLETNEEGLNPSSEDH